MKKQDKLKKGYSEKILINSDEVDFINPSNFFIKKLEQFVNDYHSDIKTNYKDFPVEKYENSFIPEALSKKSPITIIDAPWGAGKTFFIEIFAKNFIDNKIKKQYFENILIIDAWKHSDSKDIPEDIMSELFSKLSKLYPNAKKDFIKFAKITFNTTTLSWINKFFKTDFNTIEIKESPNQLIKNFRKNIKPTIIVFDNIERLGGNAWEVMKAVLKISQVEGFVFVLPMNLIKMKNNEQIDFGEFPIEKYIDIPFFTFEQNYYSLLLKMKFSETDAEIINKILETPIEGQNLSIREAQNRLKNHSINKITNKYEMMKKIYNEVWGSYSMISNILKTEIMNLDIMTQLNSQSEIFDKIKTLLLTNKNIFIENSQIINYIEENFENYRWTINFNYKSNMNKLIKLMDEEISQLENYLSDLKIKTQNILDKLKEKKNIIKGQNEEIQSLSFDIKNINKEKDPNFEMISIKENAITKYKEKMSEITTEINKGNTDLEQIENKKTETTNQILELKKLLEGINNKSKILNDFYEKYTTNIDKEIKDAFESFDEYDNPIIEQLKQYESSVMSEDEEEKLVSDIYDKIVHKILE